MSPFYSIEHLTREQVEERFDKAAENLLRKPGDRLIKSEIIRLAARLAELDGKQKNGAGSRLRDHPGMRLKSGFCVWPPVWAPTGNDDHQRPPRGEIGTLEKVLQSEEFSNVIFLVMRHEGTEFMGAMAFDTPPPFARRIYTLLKAKIGLSIREIGDLDLAHLLTAALGAQPGFDTAGNNRGSS